MVVVIKALSAVLVRETNSGQKLVYFVSKAWQWPKLRYQKVDKVILALAIAARRLRPYFVAHQVVFCTNQPIRKILHRPDLGGRIIKWAVELSEFGIKYESRPAVKAQIFADFIAELT